ncbi:NAD(P)/FAD-dependent oxidoreductase [Marilutibacter aestuarii]|uniref:FAD-dependent oxidoreductase n=1 Tax=Marilutibacter aestuarii TaxID=1706195 RepID=A0A508ACL4_9GAMM|nr:FAD-dependent oxidoreductase [Lysobacter aestuarii]TQD45568.1 FAD-dependent oxidoreductase [Lysobacter aestuarii]
MSQRIAVVGAGIAGLASAWWLSRRHEVVLFESQARLGGHTHTHEIERDGERHAVDTGFIVFNRSNYPLLDALFDTLDVASRPTTMSFSVHSEASGIEYNASTLDGLFCQRRNLASPRFLRMVADILRFNREAPALLQSPGDDPTLGEYLVRHRYGTAFRDEHLVPMASALWSSPPRKILEFPMRFLVRFLQNHQMLQVSGRPQWRVVEGGSSTYIRAMQARWQVDERLACPVESVRRDRAGVEIRHAGGRERFDQVVLACHSDDALRLLRDASADEREILGAIRYQANDAVLHGDTRLLPADPRAWAAWNAHVPAREGAPCTVTYHMNLLQGIESRHPFLVTLNRNAAIDEAKVLRRMKYRHPLHDHAAVAARARRGEIQGRRHTWFAGAYWGWGFHEDGMRSAHEVASAFGVAPGQADGRAERQGEAA